MPKLIHPLLVLIAQATEKELVLYIEYLKAENRILRSKLPKRINVIRAGRAKLIKLGVRLRSAIKELITIVHPRTFARWISEEKPGKNPRKRGRPRTAEKIRELIVKMASEIPRPPEEGFLDKPHINIPITPIIIPTPIFIPIRYVLQKLVNAAGGWTWDQAVSGAFLRQIEQEIALGKSHGEFQDIAWKFFGATLNGDEKMADLSAKIKHELNRAGLLPGTWKVFDVRITPWVEWWVRPRQGDRLVIDLRVFLKVDLALKDATGQETTVQQEIGVRVQTIQLEPGDLHYDIFSRAKPYVPTP